MSRKIYGVTVGTTLSPAKFAKKGKLVKTINGVAPDENGNVQVSGSADAVQANLDAHTGNKKNPHGVTAEQVGARPNTWLPSIADIGAAPSGYGLGEGIPTTIRSLAELDNLTLSGNYRLAMKSWTTVNNVEVANASIRVDTVINDGVVVECFQTMKVNGTNTILVRHLIGGEWSPWECVAGTEPMVVGVEYRTTERWNGNPVYAKLDNIGTTQSAASMYFSAPNVNTLIRLVPNLGGVVCTEWDASGAGANGVNTFYILPERVTGGIDMYVVCGSNRVGKTLYVQAWYTKD